MLEKKILSSKILMTNIASEWNLPIFSETWKVDLVHLCTVSLTWYWVQFISVHRNYFLLIGKRHNSPKESRTKKGTCQQNVNLEVSVIWSNIVAWESFEDLWGVKHDMSNKRSCHLCLLTSLRLVERINYDWVSTNCTMYWNCHVNSMELHIILVLHW